MAPEVIQGQPHGLQADTWSLGAVLVALKTGRPPWDHLGSLTEEEAAERMTLAELKTSLNYNACFDAREQAFLQAVLQQNWRRRPTIRQLLNTDDYVCRGPVLSLQAVTQQLLMQRSNLA